MPKSADPVVLQGGNPHWAVPTRMSHPWAICEPAISREAGLKTRLFINEELHPGEILSLGRGTAAVYSARTPDHSHDTNEDGAAIISLDAETAVLAVADGVGGARGGEQASGLAIKSLCRAIESTVGEERELRDGILDGFEKANHTVIDMAIGAASTLAAVEIEGNHVRPYHVGDSTIIVVGQRGKIKTKTIAHSPVGYGVEGGFLDENAAMNHKDRDVISNMIGSTEMHIQVGPILKLARRDTVLLASDGLSDNLHTEEIVDLIRKGPLESSVKALSEKATSRMLNPNGENPSKADDLTFVLFRLNS
ncbi:MAG: serine/threonine-protein phosphatase [Candidatus Latescibacterota bacterium]|nr:MAG: serine/threonine-protein phosphatase [Candidatus Latescibacterota bacterium]